MQMSSCKGSEYELWQLDAPQPRSAGAEAAAPRTGAGAVGRAPRRLYVHRAQPKLVRRA